MIIKPMLLLLENLNINVNFQVNLLLNYYIKHFEIYRDVQVVEFFLTIEYYNENNIILIDFLIIFYQNVAYS